MAPTVIEARISSWALLFLRAPFLKITFTRNLIASAIGAGTLFSIHLKPEKSPTIHRNSRNRCGMRMNSIQGRLEIDCQGKCEDRVHRDDFRSARHTQYD